MLRELSGVIVVLALLGLTATPVEAENLTFNDVVMKLDAAVAPASAKPGETIEWKLTVELKKGWHTYPTAQADPNHSNFVTKITFPKIDGLSFVGDIKEPKPVIKKDPCGDIATLEGKVEFEQRIKIAADAKPGKIKVAVPVKMIVCSNDTCLPPKAVTVTAMIVVKE